jgi:MFS family permease
MWLHFIVIPCFLAAIALVALWRLTDVESGPVESSEANAMLAASLIALVIPAAVLAFIGILAVKLLRGRRWARKATLIFNGIWIGLGLIALLSSARMPGAFTQPLLTIGFEGSIAICLCTPSAKAWFTDLRSESDAPLFAVQPEERE